MIYTLHFVIFEQGIGQYEMRKTEIKLDQLNYFSVPQEYIINKKKSLQKIIRHIVLLDPLLLDR